jgi:hypothetical protein
MGLNNFDSQMARLAVRSVDSLAAAIEHLAQAIEARSGQPEGLDPQGESAVGNADAPELDRP